MAIEFKDYYQILGVESGAGEEEIRRAFRNLARAYHPDKTGNDRRAEDKFKEINEAYEVLGDPRKRQRYDQFNRNWRTNPSADAAWKNFTDSAGRFGQRDGNSPGHFTFTGSGFSDFFEELFGTERGGQQRRYSGGNAASPSGINVEDRGEDLESDIWLSLHEAASGTTRPVTMRRSARCKTCYGMGQYNAHRCEACGGDGNVVRTETFTVKIPKGISEGAFLRVPGRGEEAISPSKPPGDLYLKIHFARHPDFRLEHGQLYHDLELAPWEAVLGTVVNVPTLSGRASVKIPAGTRSGAKLRLKGRGLPSADGSSGDLFVQVRIQVPEETGTTERRIWEELARESTFHPRDN